MTLRQAILDARARGSTHIVVTVARKAPPRTEPGAHGVFLARPRILGRYLGEGRPGVHVYDVAIADLQRALDAAGAT